MSENLTFSPDEWLRLYLDAPSSAESAKFFDLLIEKCVLPAIEKILSAKFGGREKDARFTRRDYEDLRGECCLKIVAALRARKIAADDDDAPPPPIKDFSAYCAAIIYNVWNAFVREQSPNRENLKNKIRYSLDRDFRFAAETDVGNENFYRLRGQDLKLSAMSVERLTAIVKEECEFFAQANLSDLLAAIFEKANGGLKIGRLVAIVAELWLVRDLPTVSLDDFQTRAARKIVRREDLETRRALENVWREIRALPVLQRVALLYNLRDELGGEMLFSFFNTRIAALDELAAAMNLDKTQFAKLLPLLPFEDKRIAAAMNLTVKRVGNLRKAARDNLRRRLDGKAKRNRRAAEESKIFDFTGEDESGAANADEFFELK